MIEKGGFAPAPMAAQFFGNAGKEHMEKYGTKQHHFTKIAAKNKAILSSIYNIIKFSFGKGHMKVGTNLKPHFVDYYSNSSGDQKSSRMIQL